MSNVPSPKCLGALLVLGAGTASAEVTLIEGGRAQTTIVLRADPSPSERWAVSDLAEHLEAMGGAKVEILPEGGKLPEAAIIVGDGPATRASGLVGEAARWGDDGYTIKTAGRRVIVAGGQLRGTMYGVYTLLEKLGCRWWAPGESTIPKLATVTVPDLDLTERPSLEYRDFLYSDCDDSEPAQLWRARNKVNGGFYKTLPERYGGAYTFDTLVHSYHKRVPPEKFFGEHPEYFALRKGKRVSNQPCFSSPEMVRLMAASIMEDAATHPEYHHFTVGQNDDDQYCECDGCKALADRYGLSGMQMDFAHRIAKLVREKHPGLRINVPAYTWSRQIPKGGMKPDANMSITLCSIECNFGQPLAEGYPEVNAAFKADIEDWGGIAAKLLIWDYTTNFKQFLMPYPNYYVLADNIRFFAEHSVVGYMAQGGHQTRNSQFAPLCMWVLAKAMWDPRRDGRALVREFIAGYYGPAAKHVQQYADDLHAAMMRDRSPLYCRMSQATYLYEPFLTPELVAGAERAFREAEAAVRGDEALARRVRAARFPVQYLAVKRSWEMWPAVAKVLPGTSFEEYCGSLAATGREAGITAIADGDRGAAKFFQWAQRYGQIRSADPAADRPPELGGIDPAKVLFVQAGQFEGQMRFLVEAEGDTDGWAQQIISHGWAIQHPMGGRDFDPGKSYRLFARVRAKAKSPAAEGMALLGGIHSKSNPAGGVRLGLPMGLADGRWQTVAADKIFRGAPSGDAFWIARDAKTKDNVEGAEIDCFWLVEEGAAQ